MDEKAAEITLVNELNQTFDSCFPEFSRTQAAQIKNLLFQNEHHYYKHSSPSQNHEKPERAFSKTSPQHIEGVAYITQIIDRLASAKCQSGEILKDFLQKNHVNISINPNESFDATGDYIPPSAENEKGNINLSFNAGIFSGYFSEDILAHTIGHELGHAVEQSSRSPEMQKQHIECKEVEGFCDTFGAVLIDAAGYDLSERTKLLSQMNFEGGAEARHPSSRHRQKLNEAIPQPHSGEGKTEIPLSIRKLMNKENWPQEEIEHYNGLINAQTIRRIDILKQRIAQQGSDSVQVKQMQSRISPDIAQSLNNPNSIASKFKLSKLERS